MESTVDFKIEKDDFKAFISGRYLVNQDLNKRLRDLQKEVNLGIEDNRSILLFSKDIDPVKVSYSEDALALLRYIHGEEFPQKDIFLLRVEVYHSEKRSELRKEVHATEVNVRLIYNEEKLNARMPLGRLELFWTHVVRFDIVKESGLNLEREEVFEEITDFLTEAKNLIIQARTKKD